VTSQWPGPPSWPITDTGRTPVKPGVSIGTRIIDWRLWGAASGSVVSIAMATEAPL
jgi:hypothetical protein